MNKTTTEVRKKSDDNMTFLDLWHLCLGHWNWILASLVICLGVASYYLLVSQNMYTREMAVLVKQETQGKNTICVSIIS